jgi:hypothetical protein
MKVNWHNTLEVLLTLLIGIITAYLIYSNSLKEKQPTACEINPKSNDCYIETMNDEYDYDYQLGGGDYRGD